MEHCVYCNAATVNVSTESPNALIDDGVGEADEISFCVVRVLLNVPRHVHQVGIVLQQRVRGVWNG